MKQTTTQSIIITGISTLIALLFSAASYGQNTYYSYKDIHLWNGNWNHEFTWTLVENGEDISVPSVAPQNGDQLIITENTTVRLTSNIALSGLSIEIRQGATLVLGQYEFTNALANLSGSGNLVIEKIYFPQVSNQNHFGGISGGDLWINTSQTGNIALPQSLHDAYNLTITANGNGQLNLSLPHHLTVNGSLVLRTGNPSASFNWIAGSGSSVVEISIAGNLTIEERVAFRIATFNRIHQISLGGNLIVNGALNLSNASQYQNANNGAAEFTFNGLSNTTVTGSGNQLDFYRLIIDKGSDATWLLDIQHTAFRLFGPTNQSNGGSDPNPIINKALWIKNGTLRLGHGIIIEELTSGGHDFFIPLNGALHIDGASVYTTRNGNNNTALTIIGTLKITEGLLDTRTSAGIIYRGTGQIIIEGGEVKTTQVRPSGVSGDHQLTWIQTGGVVDVHGDYTGNNGFPRFSLPLGSHSFTMTGGELIVRKPYGNNRGMAIGADPGNSHVTGGTIKLYIPSNTTFGLSATAPLFNVEIFAENNNSTLLLTHINHSFSNNSAQPLHVLNNLILHNNAKLNANGNDVSIGRSFSIANGAAYITGTNTTRIYNRTENNFNITLNNATGNNTVPLAFHHVEFDIAAQQTVNFNGTGNNADFAIEFNGNITQNGARSKLNFNGFRSVAKGNITIEDFPTTRKIEWLNTILTLAGNQQQDLKIRGWYDGGPSRIILDNTHGARMLESVSLGGSILELRNGVFFIGSNELTTNRPVEKLNGDFNANAMIATNGLAGDGGYRLRIRGTAVNGSTQIVFPVGVQGKFTPMTLTITGQGSVNNQSNNFITVSPVNKRHPNASGTNVLKYYWKTDVVIDSHANNNIENFTFGYIFSYAQEDIMENNGSNRAMLLEQGDPNWQAFSFQNNNPLNFSSLGFISGDFTAGRNNEFQGGNLSPVFTSKASGSWTNANTWNKEGSGNMKYPGEGSIVIIAADHTVTVPSNGQKAEFVRVTRNATLDLGTTTNHRFESVTGNGMLRLSSGNLPKNSNNNYDNLYIFHFVDGGIIEYYGTQNINLPNDFREYNRLNIHGAGQKTLPGGVVTINNELRIIHHGVLKTNPNATGTLIINGTMLFDNRQGNIENTLLLSHNRGWEIHFNGNIMHWESANIAVEKTGNAASHKVFINGGFAHGRGKMDLWGNGSVTGDLYVKSNHDINFGNGQYGGKWQVRRLIVDLGSPSNTLTIAREFEIAGATNQSEKALALIRGRLLISQRGENHPNQKNFTLSSGGSDFVIPVNASLIAEGSNTIRTLNNSNIILDGSLILRGNAKAYLGYTGNEDQGPQNNSQCDIIYGTAGKSRLEIHANAGLFFTGQLRRATTSEAGALTYHQTGNTQVTAGTGKPATTTRATFEVLNQGSEFILTSEATLTIANSASETFPALYLEPSVNQISGTIVMGSNNTQMNNIMGLRTSAPVFHLQVLQQNSPVVYLHTHPLTINGNISIQQGAELQTRGLDAELKGNMLVNGSFTSQNGGNFIFSGNAHAITGQGSIQYHHVRLDAITGLSLQNDIRATGNVHIVRGTLIDNSREINVSGNISNNGLHMSQQLEGGFILQAQNNQEITGQGFFGRIVIDKTPEHQLIAQSDIRILDELVLTNGIFNIRQYKLTLYEDALITPGAQDNTFNASRMIQLAGNMGDGGLRKLFSQNDINAGIFTFPMGSNGKYAGLEILDLTNFTAGRSITTYPVELVHPTIGAGLDGADPNKVLRYYWGIETDLAGSEVFGGKLRFSFHNSYAGGNLNNYFSAQLRNEEDDTWAKLAEGIDQQSNTITFNHLPAVNRSILSGFYTAGEEIAIPDNVPHFVATQSGNWETSSGWSNGQTPPSGVIVEIPAGVVITITENMKRVYKTVINGKLRVEPGTTFHNLGIVEGQGTLEVNGTGDGNPINLPAGRYESFMECGNNSTIVFDGQGGLLPSGRTSYNNIILKGTGNKSFPLAPNMNICGLLSMEDQVQVITRNDQVYEINGHLAIGENASIQADKTRAHFLFTGTQPQQISGNFTSTVQKSDDSNALYRVSIQNNLGVEILGGGLEITQSLYLDNGILTSRNNSLLLSNPSPSALGSYSTSSYVNGAMMRVLPAASQEAFVFPVSENQRARFVSLYPHSSASGIWTSEYYNNDASVAGMNTANLNDPLKRISNQEYWRVEGPANASAFVSLHWGPESGISITDDDLASMHVAEWNTGNSKWESAGMSDISANGNGYGYITSNVVGFSEKYFTFGTTDPFNPLPIELLSFTAQMQSENVLLEWITAAEINNDFFTIEKSTDGRNFHIIAHISSKAINGHSNDLLAYQMMDEQPGEGLVYYRLKQTDFDGSFEYSDIVAVQVQNSTVNTFSVYPNPNRGDYFRIALQGLQPYEASNLFITDLSGKTVLHQTVTADANGTILETIDTGSRLPQGTYIVSLRGSNEILNSKLVVR